MAIDTSSINTLINDFRALSQKDSISPESLGALLQRLADLLASCTSDTEAKPLQDLLNKISTLPDVVLSIANGTDDLKNVLANISKGNILTGKVSSLIDQILVRPASAERAGAMTAQHVSDLTSTIATATKAKEDLSALTQENAKEHAAIRKEATDALAAHAAANDKAFADEASARKAVSDALTAHETADAADHAAIRKTLSDSLASATQEQHDALAAHEKTDAADHAAIRKTLSDSLASATQEQHDTLACSGIVAFDGFVGDVSYNTHGDTGAPIVRDPKGKVQQSAATVHFSTADCNFLIKQDGTYYPTWTDDYLWQDRNLSPWADKAYYNVNDGKLYKIGTDDQLHEITLTALRDDIGILPCRVRTAAPLAEPTTGYPTAHNYTIWWSQTTKAFFAALGYEAAQGDAIEGCEYYPLSVCDEYYDYCSVTVSGSTQTAVPRADRIFRSGNDLWQYDKTSGTMVKLGDVTGKDLAIRNLKCGDASLQGDVEVTGLLEVGNSLTVIGGLTVDKGNITCLTGDIQGYGVRGNLAKFGEADEVEIDVDGNISTKGNILGVNITAKGNINAGSLTVNTATLSDTTLNGDTTLNEGKVSVDSGSLVVASGVGFYADNINAVRIDGRIDFVIHGIRQSLPTDYTAVAQSVSPSTRVDGSTYDIIYIRDKKRFVAVDDAAKTYAERFYDEEEYNIITNNKPTTARTDRTWQWGADTYKYDTEAYISAYYGKGNDRYGADLVCVTDAGKALFIKMWRDAIYRPMVGMVGWYGDCDDLGNCYGGKNNPQFQLDYGGYYPEWHETPGFFINGITGISYAEARQIYDVRTCGSYPHKISDGGGIRTNMLCCYNYAAGGGQNGQGINTPFVFQSNDVLVVRVAAGKRGQRPTGTAAVYGQLSFYNSDNVEEVIGAVWPGSLGDKAFNSIFPPFGSKLQYLWIVGLSVSLTKTFAKASSINVDCLRYLVEKSRATAAKPISVTLHADVFAALPDDILTLAETKYVTFVSA